MKTLIENLIKKTCHAEFLASRITPHPNPVLDLLHAHRVSPKLLRNRRLNLLAIRTRFTPSVRKSALPQGAREKRAAFTLAETLITLGITGVVAVLTIAPLVQKYRIKQLETAFKHSSSMIEQALLKTVQEYGFSNVTELSNTCGSPVFIDNKGNLDNNHPQTINYKNCRSEYQSNIIPEMYQDFISNFHIIKSYSYEDCQKLFANNNIYTYYGNPSLSNICYPYNPAGINILENGSSIYTIFSFLYHNQTDGLTLIFDTNGPNKGPNRYGYDIFMYNTGHWTKLCSKENGDIESRYNGRGCYDYALKNQNPDDDTKGYWESLKL